MSATIAEIHEKVDAFLKKKGLRMTRPREVIIDTIMADPRAHAEPEPFIQVTNLGGSSVDFLVRVWCNASETSPNSPISATCRSSCQTPRFGAM